MPETSEGERRFRAYLDQLGFTSQYEPEIGGRHPDFLVETHSGQVVCEVYEPEIHLRHRVGAFDPYPALRRGYEARKAQQIQAAQSAGLPFVLVYASTNSDIGIQSELVEGAMFGNIAISFPINPDTGAGDLAQSQTIFAGGGRVQPDRKRGLSAAAVIKRFNPTNWVFQEEYERRGIPQRLRAAGDLSQFVEECQSLTNELVDAGRYNPELLIERLIVMHNPWAQHPLEMTAFSGPHDLQRGPLGANYCDLALGVKYKEVLYESSEQNRFL